MEWPLEVLRVKMATIETMSLVNLHVLHHRNDCDGNDIHCRMIKAKSDCRCFPGA